MLYFRMGFKIKIIVPCYLQKVGRSLFCLGLLIRYGNRLLANSGNKLVDFGSSVRLFIKHLSAEDFVVKVRSLQV